MAFGADISETLGNVGNRTTAHGYGKADEIRKQYTGYEHDDESGLDFAQARYYNASHGRFTSVDPLTASASIKDPQTFNRYTYAMNSPYKFTDPLGLISSSTNACGQSCRNTATSSEMDTERVGGEFSDEGHQTADQPPPPPVSNNGATLASSVTPSGGRFNTAVMENGSDYAVFADELAKNATNLQNTVETNQVASTLNRDAALAASKEAVQSADHNNWREPVADILDVFTDRDYGSINSDGTVRVVTPTSGSVGMSLSGGVASVSGTSNTTTSTNSATTLAETANAQRGIVNEIKSPTSQTKANFLRDNATYMYSVYSKDGKFIRRQVVTQRDLGVIYDTAVTRGLNAANNQLLERYTKNKQ